MPRGSTGDVMSIQTDHAAKEIALTRSALPESDTKPKKTPTWFAFNEERPLSFFAGIWTSWQGKRGTKANPVEGEHQLFGFLTTDPNVVVGAFHPKAMPVILTTESNAQKYPNGSDVIACDCIA